MNVCLQMCVCLSDCLLYKLSSPWLLLTFLVFGFFSTSTVYKTRVVESMQRPGGFIDWWGKRHLASNIVLTETNLPLSNRFTILEGIHSKVLVFGFIYHLENPAPEVKVLDPAEVVEERWFRNALRDNPHSAVLVMAHMGIDDPSIQPIFQAIRKWDGDDMPIQFIAGHTHLRRWSTLDPFSNAVESGRYLDTVGFISMPTIDTVIQRKKQQRDDDEGQQPKDELFRHEFVDANIDEMNAYLGRSNDTTNNDFSTEDGRALTAYIQRTKNELGLNTILGCSTGDYFVNRSLDEVDSLWAVYQNQVVPSQLETDDSIHRVIFISQASWRYDLFAKENSYDDIVAVSPFNEPIFLVGTLPCDIIVKLNYTMNHNLTTPNYLTVLPAYILSGTVILGVDCELYTHHFELDSILEHLSILYPPTDQFEVQTTSLTSTTIWTNFFQTEWPCDGQKTNPTTPWSIDFNSIEKHIKDEGVDKRKVLLFVIPSTILGMIIFCWLGKKIWQTIKHFHFRIGYSQQGPSVLDDDDEEEEIEVEDRTFTDDIETDLHLT